MNVAGKHPARPGAAVPTRWQQGAGAGWVLHGLEGQGAPQKNKQGVLVMVRQNYPTRNKTLEGLLLSLASLGLFTPAL